MMYFVVVFGVFGYVGGEIFCFLVDYFDIEICMVMVYLNVG